ncbi:glycosyltransferase family 61 protein [Bacillus sp. NPDC094106]|uniref:glycosyltransferase family 61 protein n=1 Tax=Bacillus sp. NPDC094106 TaxID=3363949 RepID=UPI00382C8BA4
MSERLRLPRGVYTTVDDWRNSNGRKEQNSYIDLGMMDYLCTSPPKTIYSEVHLRFGEELHLSKPAFLVVLNNARVFYESIITEDNHLLFELSPEVGKKPEEHSVFDRRNLPRLQKHRGNIAVLTFNASATYYHWMFDILARLYLLELGNIQYDKIIMSNQHNLKFQKETLDLFEIESDSILTVHENFHLEARNVIVPSLIGYTGAIPKWACDYLRNKLLRYSKKITGYERVFVSRENARWRKLLNEEQVFEMLKKHGFKKVVLEELSVLEQINLFVSAEVIIAPHGSGFANLVFCNPNTKVIELFSPNYVHPMYWRLSNYMNLDYYYIIGKMESQLDYVDSWIVEDDIVIDIQQLKNTLLLADLI